jgi:hypothetical protein
MSEKMLSVEEMERRLAKFPRGEKMTVDEVAAVVGPEFKEMNENPPDSVTQVRERMQGKESGYRPYRSQQGDPKWIVAKYPGTAADGTAFRRGEKVLYWPRTKTIMVGRQAEDAWAKFESEAADEAAMSGHYASETDTEGKFEEGKPADPTENMTEEQKKEWWAQHEKNKDQFKAAVRQRLSWDNDLAGAEAKAALPGDIVPGETDTVGKFEEGKPADPTKDMSPEDAKKWKEMNEKHKDNFKGASEAPPLRQRLTWASEEAEKESGKEKGPGVPDGTGPSPECPLSKEAALGLYGFTKGIEKTAQGTIKKVQKMATRIAKAITSRNDQVASFLSTHSRRATSIPARILVAAIQEEAKRRAGEIKAGHPKAAGGERGLYGFPTKTASLGLNACSELRGYAGTVTYDLHNKRTADYEKITGFFKEHSKQGKCHYAKMLLACYPEATEKTASQPSSVEEWLAWEE